MILQKIKQIFTNKTLPSPLITIVTPSAGTPKEYFNPCLHSVLTQTDKRVKWLIGYEHIGNNKFKTYLEKITKMYPQVSFIECKGGIAACTNDAIKHVKTPYIGFIDDDDLLTKDAIKRTLKAFDNGADIVYSDETKVTQDGLHFVEPFFKPAWSPRYFMQIMYVGHFLAIKKDLLEKKTDLLDSKVDGVQDFDFMLRLSKKTTNISHIPEVNYRWRKIPRSISSDINAKGTIINDRMHISVSRFMKQSKFDVKISPDPHRMEIIPKKTSKKYNTKTIIITNKSAKDIDSAIKQSTEEFIILKQKDVKFSKANETYLLGFFNFPDVGIITPRIVSDKQTILSCGCVAKLPKENSFIGKGYETNSSIFAHLFKTVHEVDSPIPVYFVIRKSHYNNTGGIDHTLTTYWERDLALRMYEQGQFSLCIPKDCIFTKTISYNRKDFDKLLKKHPQIISKELIFNHKNIPRMQK